MKLFIFLGAYFTQIKGEEGKEECFKEFDEGKQPDLSSQEGKDKLVGLRLIHCFYYNMDNIFGMNHYHQFNFSAKGC